MTALWYVMRGAEPWIWTYAKSQKVRNLERDERATLLVEAGDEYHELRGVMLRARAEIARDIDDGRRLRRGALRQVPGRPARSTSGMREALRAQAAKRVAIRFEVDETVSWDHAKLGGAY